MLRGALEFSGSTCLLVALKVAMDHDINQGLSTAMMSLAGLMITIMSWLFYGERLNWVHSIGMVLILVAIFFMGYFNAGPEGGADIHIEGLDSSTKDMLEVLMWGVFASLSFAFEVMWIKWLLFRGVEGF